MSHGQPQRFPPAVVFHLPQAGASIMPPVHPPTEVEKFFSFREPGAPLVHLVVMSRFERIAPMTAPASHPCPTARRRSRPGFSTLLLAGLLLAGVLPAPGATIWTGPRLTYNHTQGRDEITPNVWLTRGVNQGLYNSQQESGFTHLLSPVGTRWANGTTANFGTLSYTDWNTWAKGVNGGPPTTVGVNAVVHLIAEDIYIDIKFLSWFPGGAYSYERSTPAGANQPPTVSITNPAPGAVLAAGSLSVQATAADPDGSVTNVEFFAGTTSLGQDATAPFSIGTTLAPGAYTLTAVAWDNAGAAATSAPVNVTLTNNIITNPILARIPKGSLSLELVTVADGMASPLGMAAANDGTGRLFVYDQSGLIWLVTAAGRAATPMLDLRARLSIPARFDYDERGLLGAATHPNFASQPYIYTLTSETNGAAADFPSALNPGTTNNHQAVLAEWRIDAANTNRFDPASRREVLRIDEPQSNHNGGTLRFGPDGFLYITLGDGGAANDVGNGHVPGGNAQVLSNVLGKVLRIDVNGSDSANGRYGVPAGNPFNGITGLREIYAYGLRNPFAFSFDRSNGDLYLADVGQNRVEEINRITAGGNYGWSVKEGTFWFDPALGAVVGFPTRPVPPGLIDPIAQYDHDDGLAIIGGFVYRGSAFPALQGRYVFGDWGSFGAPSGRLFYLDTGDVIREFVLGLNDRPLGHWVKGFGEGPDGELYVFASRQPGPAGNTGIMFKIVPGPKPITILSLTPTNGTNVAEVWCGGMGPYAVQKRSDFRDATWFNAAFTTQTNAVTSLDTPAGFYRVSDTARQPGIPLSAWLSGLNERPTALTNSASGSALFSLDGNTLTFNIRYEGLSSNATAAHIHGSAAASGSAGILIDLASFNGGSFSNNGSFSGQIVISDAHKAAILAGRTYVNVHTVANPAGEMRGQITPVLMQASLSGGNERPAPVNTAARGLGVFTLVGNQLSFNLTYRGLSGAAVAAHIHGPASQSASAGILVDLGPFNGGAFGSNGTLSGTVTLTAPQLAAVIDGLTYVNVHTPMHGGGEMRGHILPQATAVPFTAPLTGLSERPTPITNSASGTAFFSLEGNQLSFSISYRDLSSASVAAHIHGPSAATNTAGVLVDLAPFNGGGFGATSGTLAGTVTLSSNQLVILRSGQAYVNVHSTMFGPGEIRGQIAPVLFKSYLSGAEERPTPILSSGSGLASLALVLNQLSLNVTYRNLSSSAVASHIHGASAVNGSAGVLVDLAPLNGGAFGFAGSLVGTVTLAPGVLANLIDGATYLNVHSGNFGSGEIRGQIQR